MKKLFVIVLTLAFVMAGGMCFATDGPGNPNAIWQGGSAQIQQGNQPCTFVRVRYGMCSPNAPSLASGTVVSWDINSADGITVSACIGLSTTQSSPAIAGVLISDVPTDDSSGFQSGERCYGYMAIHGYCLASVDTSVAEAGHVLAPTNAANNPGMFGTVGDGGMVVQLSQDVGVLLQDTGTDGPMPVYLNL